MEDDDENESNEQKIYLNYLHGDYIYHDPKVGITNILTPPIADPVSNNDSGALNNIIDSIPGYSTWAFLSAMAIGSLLLIKKYRK